MRKSSLLMASLAGLSYHPSESLVDTIKSVNNFSFPISAEKVEEKRFVPSELTFRRKEWKKSGKFKMFKFNKEKYMGFKNKKGRIK